MKDLIIVILTFYLDEILRPPKYMPKVCYKVDGTPMIQTSVENSLKLSPSKIIIYASKYHVQFINKLLKHSDYAKIISFYIFDNMSNTEKKLSFAGKCLKNKNLLFIPANMPLLSTKTMFRMISENKDIKVTDSLFYLRSRSYGLLDKIKEMEITDFLVPKIELTTVDMIAEWKDVEKYVAERKKKINSFLKKRISKKDELSKD